MKKAVFGTTQTNKIVSEALNKTDKKSSIARYIDHTLLKADASEEQVITVCKEARQYNFASVCVNPYYVSLVSRQLEGSDVKTCCVIGFPLGSTLTEVKVHESVNSINNGADELDMVINIGAIKSSDWQLVKSDIESVVNAAKGKAIVKVIIETCLLNEEEKVKACEIAKMADADFVKTSTGFSTAGATVGDISLMRKTVGPDMGVKASGGVRDYQSAMAMIKAGANRIGSSNGITIVKEEQEN